MKPISVADRDARLKARARRRRRLLSTDSVESMRMRVDLYNRRQSELEPVELSDEGLQLCALAALYLETVELFRSAGASPQFG